MSSALLQVQNISKRFGGFTALDGVSFTLEQGERFGIIGPNGSGKTTLMNCIGGALYGDSGTIRFLPIVGLLLCWTDLKCTSLLIIGKVLKQLLI